MEDPKRQAWMYVIAGVVAVGAAVYFISTADQANGSFGILDYAILGMGLVAIYRGAKGLLALRGGVAGADGSSKPGTGPRPSDADGDGPSEGSQGSGGSKNS